MTDSLRFQTKFRFPWAHDSLGAAVLIAIVALVAAMQPARAQNLVPDPYFVNALPSYGQTDGSGNTYYVSNATETTFDGTTGVLLTGSSYGYFEIAPLAGYNTNGVNYVLTFLAAAVNPQTSTEVFSSFGPTTPTSGCGGNGCTNLLEPVTSSGLTQFTSTGTSASGEGYFYVQAYGGGDVFVTGLNFEPAPAPLPGAGAISILTAFAGLAFHRLRRRKAV